MVYKVVAVLREEAGNEGVVVEVDGGYEIHWHGAEGEFDRPLGQADYRGVREGRIEVLDGGLPQRPALVPVDVASLFAE